MLAELRARLGRAHREPAHEAHRMDRPVAVVEDRAVEAVERIVDPFCGDAVPAHRLVLGVDLLALLLVGCEAQAPWPAERVAGELLDPVERTLGPVPECARLLASVRLARDVVPRGASAEREAAVASARAFRDPALVVHAHAQAVLGEAKRSGATGDAGADDRDVDTARLLHHR